MAHWALPPAASRREGEFVSLQFEPFEFVHCVYRRRGGARFGRLKRLRFGPQRGPRDLTDGSGRIPQTQALLAEQWYTSG